MIKIAPKRGRQRQRGAETIEFLLTFLLFLLVFFLIVDMAIAFYNRGTVIYASREGARQASLFWIDPDLFNPLTPASNQLLKISMVESVMNSTEANLLIDPEAAGLTMTLQVNGVEMINPTQPVSSNDVARVDVSFPHSYLMITAMTGIEGPNLASTETLGVE
jgi:lipopolysaccharide/colanic/teichoic acid biosynthesis glycosyltransferase